MDQGKFISPSSRTLRSGSTNKGKRPRLSRRQVNDGALVRSPSDKVNVPNEIIGAQTSSSQQGSFFQSSRNVSINGGEFNSSRLHHTNLTININQSGPEESVDIDRSCQAPSLKTFPHDLDHVPQDDLRLSAEPGSSQRILEPYAGKLHQSPLPVQKSSDLYRRHLATRGRGSPLWIPEPNRNLPIEYQRKGISIGDVGILTDNGGFDFLFNICLPQGDPINPEEMPEDFHPLKAPGTRDVINNLEFKANSYLASSSVTSSQRDEDSFGLTFESSASEGAILTMPRGSLSRDLTSKITFKRYASANVVKWYRYVNEVCGREANNGDVRLVVGLNSAAAWGMATFANLSQQTAFRLRFKPTGERSLASGAPYGWDSSGTAEVKSGPDTEEIDRLRMLDGEAGRDGLPEYENQTLFVRTINVTIQDDIWNKLSAEWEELYLEDDSKDSVTDKGDHSIGTPNRSSNLTESGTGPGIRGGASNNAPQEGSPSFKRHKRFQSVYLSELPSAIASHPSKMINRLLLERRPSSRFAITDDDEWISVIKETDKVLPPPQTLFARILERHDICEEGGVVFFQQNNKDGRHIDAIRVDPHPDSKTDENADSGSQLHVSKRRFKSPSFTDSFMDNASRTDNSSSSVNREHGVSSFSHFSSSQYHSSRQRSLSIITNTQLSRASSPMSPIQNDPHDEGVKTRSVYGLEDAKHPNDGTEPGTSASAVKRGRGRPKGSKNKKFGLPSAEPQSSAPSIPRKRGRPPKEKKDDSGEEPPPKRSRGRPPKNPKPAGEEAMTSGETAREPSAKKKRGRPPKKAPGF